MFPNHVGATRTPFLQSLAEAIVNSVMLSTALKKRLFGTLLIVYVSGPPDPGFYQQAQADSEDNESCMDWDKYN